MYFGRNGDKNQAFSPQQRRGRAHSCKSEGGARPRAPQHAPHPSAPHTPARPRALGARLEFQARGLALSGLLSRAEARLPISRPEAPRTKKEERGDEYTQEHVQFVNNRNFNYRRNHLPTYYHRSLRSHENFSYANNRNVLQPPPDFNQQAVEKKPSVEDLLSTFIVETSGRFNKDEARLDNIETHCNNMNATMKSLEVQISQLANAVKG
ncbi:hypothetical protein TIFTF001_011976 [Ficus carica]|uniref:Uncharacterized protein n=1 Tax=Ficus carica TaxID=3494 RepID=A0AA88ABG7_FICCA|nr:hypothetical protein TIFTF001_011976 [Ficus carica]